MTFSRPRAVILAVIWCCYASVAWGQASFKTPLVGGLIMSADNQTLIVSLPSAGTLAFYDTLADKETKKVEVEFQPTSLAVQGSKLFAAAKGSAIIRVLDAATAGGLRAIKVIVPLRSAPADGTHEPGGARLLIIARSRVAASTPEVTTLWQIVQSVHPY